MGRCGSILFYRSVCQHLKPAPHEVFSFVRDPGKFDFKNGFCYKSHTHAPEAMPENAKLVFLFGDPLHIIVSLKLAEKEWGYEGMKYHFENMGAEVGEYKRMYEKDILHLEEMFDSYQRSRPYHLMTIRYETMWKYQKKIGKFLGIKGFRFPPYKPRQSLAYIRHMSKKDVETILATYGRLREKIKSAPDIKVWTAL
jgi:hypothetical protein